MRQLVRICVVGSTMVDLVTRVARLPAPGETFFGRSFSIGFGGKGGNQAVMAAKLGARVSLISRVGGDSFGDAALKNYGTVGVDATHVTRDAAQATGVAPIFVDDAAQNCIVVVPGANAAVSAADVTAATATIEQADVVVAQLETPVAATLAAFGLARERGAITLFNPAPAEPVPGELWSLCDVVVPNESEAERLTGIAVTDDAAAERAARALLARGAGAVILTLGRRGSLILTATERFALAPIAVEAVDTTGAGDAYVGTLAVYLGARMSLVEAARRANVVAALSVTRSGTQTSFPDAADADAFLARYDL
jgi:ribokinase